MKKQKQNSNIIPTFVVGRSLQVIFQQAQNKFIYKSAIADFDEHYIAIMPLTKAGRPAQLRKGERINVIYHGLDAMYQFTAEVAGHRRENNINLALLKRPPDLIRIQRREFYRLHISFEGSYKKGLWKEKEKGRIFACYRNIHPCLLEDISGGGLALHTKKPLDEGSFIKVRFIIPLKKNSSFVLEEVVQVIRKKKINTIDKKEDYDYIYGTSFVDIDENKQGDILKFVMWQQLEQRRAIKES